MDGDYSQGICADGAAILKQGRMMTVDEIVTELNQQKIQIGRMARVLTERDQALAEAEKRGSPAVAAIEYALSHDEGLLFLRYWFQGEFDVLRNEWEDIPDAVFDGADPLFESDYEDVPAVKNGRFRAAFLCL